MSISRLSGLTSGLAVLTVAITLTGCSSSGGSALGLGEDSPAASVAAAGIVVVVTPEDQTLILTAGTAMTPSQPLVASEFGEIITYAVQDFETLPAGLVLNPTTGVITGTPTTAQSATDYYIDGLLPGLDTATALITITIEPAATPVTISPRAQAVTLTVGKAMTPTARLVPSQFPEIITYAVHGFGTLPAGLVLNPTTGVITGTPTTAQAAMAYPIDGLLPQKESATATITITVAAAPKAAPTLLPTRQDASGIVGTALTATRPFVASGFTGAVTYAITPSLPAGLALNPATSVITGTPAAAQSPQAYTITASDPTGARATTVIAITITATRTSATMLPTSQDVTGTVGTALTATRPFATTGLTGAVTYAITPASPAGLGLNPVTGVITGTPTAVQAAQAYTVTATDTAGGRATAAVAITITVAKTNTAPAPTTAPTGTSANPEQAVRIAAGITLLGRTQADATKVTMIKAKPARSIAKAPKAKVTTGTPMALRTRGAKPAIAYSVALRVKGTFVSLGTVTAANDGTLRLPVLTIAKAGTYPISLVDASAGGRTSYVTAVVAARR